MRVLVCYDVANTDRHGQRRLRKIGGGCGDQGGRAPVLLCECLLAEGVLVVLRARLLGLFDSEQDSLRFYLISEDSARKTEHHGVRMPIDVTAPLVI